MKTPRRPKKEVTAHLFALSGGMCLVGAGVGANEIYQASTEAKPATLQEQSDAAKYLWIPMIAPLIVAGVGIVCAHHARNLYKQVSDARPRFDTPKLD